MNAASSLMDKIFLLHTFLSVVAQRVSMLTMLFHLPAAPYNAWCIRVNDLGIVADIIPHLEEVSRFIVTSIVEAVLMQP
jgi:hypothetical protein